MMSEKVMGLALPRGRKVLCELCLGPATLRCVGCGVTYYCDVNHQSADWVSVHEKICQLLIPLRTALPFYNSDKERKHGREQTISREKFLAGLTQSVAQKFLSEGKHEDSIPAALHSLKFHISVYGSHSVELVPAFIILAEASLGLGHLAQAEEYLSQAQWIVLKKSYHDFAIQSKLHRNLGLLFAAKGNYEESLFHLANDVFFACSAFGTNHIASSGGYFHMANVFYRQKRMDIAESLYSEVTDIWYKYFDRMVEIQFEAMMAPPEIDMLAEEADTTEEPLDEGLQAEATQMLNAILELREQGPKPQPAKIARVLHTLAMLHYLSQKVSKAQELTQAALQMIKQLPKHTPFAEESFHRLIKLIKSKSFYAK